MVRTRVRWGRVAGLAAAVAVTVGVVGGAAHAGGQHSQVRTYVVRPGDSLWAIAARIAGPRADPRPLVDSLAELNHTGGRLVPGQILRLPQA
jgi:Tfp pilus assembly protein FimV